MFTARQAATKICAANCANGSFAQFAAKESSQKSKKPAISSTKWSNFAKPKQTRVKARDYELGNTFRHTRSRGLKPAPGSWYEARSLRLGFRIPFLEQVGNPFLFNIRGTSES